MGQDYLLDLMRSNQTVFTIKDLGLMWGVDRIFAQQKIYRYKKTGKINFIRRGIYSKDKNYDKYELATRIFTPAYISFETVLGAAGVTFQYYGQIFAASYQTREIECDGQKYAYRKIKNSILINPQGVVTRGNYSIASPERAFLDIIYLYTDYHFDNLRPINFEKVYDILPIYGGNKRMLKKIKMYQQIYLNDLK